MVDLKLGDWVKIRLMVDGRASFKGHVGKIVKIENGVSFRDSKTNIELRYLIKFIEELNECHYGHHRECEDSFGTERKYLWVSDKQVDKMDASEVLPLVI